MSDAFYAEMQEVATEVIGEFQQGEIKLETVTETVGDEPWIVGSSTITYVLSGVAKPVDRKFVDGTLVVATDIEVVCSVRATRTHIDGAQLTPVVADIDPHMDDWVIVDTKRRKVKKVRRIPEAGTVVAYGLVISG